MERVFCYVYISLLVHFYDVHLNVKALVHPSKKYVLGEFCFPWYNWPNLTVIDSKIYFIYNHGICYCIQVSFSPAFLNIGTKKVHTISKPILLRRSEGTSCKIILKYGYRRISWYHVWILWRLNQSYHHHWIANC